ncbi:hypothetical protein [Flavobacterium sp. HJ-32-4]|uniref:hypothetical protein n=1 Tax=Flavobacterium sp. HJ-32-4 TaxID=1160795 RepID=UPI001F149075|nr:hypothetical protein [Flavobacterium sp. HJ-32-4]UMY65302.1 hypothetical protein MKO97_12430 [Flavobacterium sp. HJ-32-4]
MRFVNPSLSSRPTGKPLSPMTNSRGGGGGGGQCVLFEYPGRIHPQQTLVLRESVHAEVHRSHRFGSVSQVGKEYLLRGVALKKKKKKGKKKKKKKKKKKTMGKKKEKRKKKKKKKKKMRSTLRKPSTITTSCR